MTKLTLSFWDRSFAKLLDSPIIFRNLFFYVQNIWFIFLFRRIFFILNFAFFLIFLCFFTDFWFLLDIELSSPMVKQILSHVIIVAVSTIIPNQRCNIFFNIVSFLLVSKELLLTAELTCNIDHCSWYS